MSEKRPIEESPNWRPHFTRAEYRDPGIDAYRGNPCVEALPKIQSPASAIKFLANYPAYDNQDRQLPAEVRLHLVETALELFVPMDIHLDLEMRISRLIRRGYVGRNPLPEDFLSDINARTMRLENPQARPRHRPSTASGMHMIGLSGAGKSTGSMRILGTYPQVIVHQEFKGKPFNHIQIVWLKLECPFDGSTKAVCVKFLRAVDSLLGTTYEEDYTRGGRQTTEQLILALARVASIHSIGLLIFDELQHVSASKSGGAEKLLNFFVELTNVVGVPLLMVGTFKAMGVLCSGFRQIRRGCSEGDMFWKSMENDAEFEILLRAVWRYQYTKECIPLTREIQDVIHYESCGILDFVIKLLMLAQFRAIATGKERVTVGIIRAVAHDSILLAKPILDALRSNDLSVLKQLDDIRPLDFASAVRRIQLEKPHRVPSGNASGSTVAQPDIHEATGPQQVAPDPGAEKPALGPVPKLSKRRIASKAQQGRGLLAVTSEGEAKGISAYDAMRAAGLIQPAAEFIEKKVA